MKSRFNTYPKRLAAILLILLTGCAAPRPVVVDETFPVMAQKMLSAGIQQISELYIDPVRVSDLAIEGLRGLESIDKDFKLKVTPSKIVVNSDRISDHAFSKPVTESKEEWTEMMLATLQFMRAHSSSIGNAGQEKLFEAVFDGSVSILDKFSRYTGARQAHENRARRSGFGGIGVTLKAVKNGGLVLAVLESSPANLAGIKVKDLITKIDNNPVEGLGKKSILSAIRGKIGSFISLTVRRKNAGKLTFSVKRQKIFLPTVKLIEEKGILYIGVSNFNEETALQLAKKVQKAMQSAKNSIVGVIMDLRGNPGGILSQAIKVADLFLESGKILTTLGRHPSSRNEYVAGGNDVLTGLPLVVLINGRSASASEIVAAALQDHLRAIIVGTSSFGKGSVQSVSRLPNDGELILTWSRFVTPSGNTLNNLGVQPNICSIGVKPEAENFVFEALKKASEFAKRSETWLKDRAEITLERETLRRSCPASFEQKIMDTRIAEKLILDNTLYSQIIGLSSTLASTHQ